MKSSRIILLILFYSFCGQLNLSAQHELFFKGSYLHNSVISTPDLPPIDSTCRDCSGYRDLPAAGFSFGIELSNAINKSFQWIIGIDFDNRNYIMRQNKSWAASYLTPVPAIEQRSNTSSFRLPVLLQYSFRRLQFAFGIRNSFYSITTRKVYTDEQELIQKNTTREFQLKSLLVSELTYKCTKNILAFAGVEQSQFDQYYFNIGVKYKLYSKK